MEDSINQNKLQYEPISLIGDKAKKMFVFAEYIQILKLPSYTNAVITNKSNSQSDRSTHRCPKLLFPSVISFPIARDLSHPPSGRIYHTGIWPPHNS